MEELLDDQKRKGNRLPISLRTRKKKIHISRSSWQEDPQILSQRMKFGEDGPPHHHHMTNSSRIRTRRSCFRTKTLCPSHIKGEDDTDCAHQHVTTSDTHLGHLKTIKLVRLSSQFSIKLSWKNLASYYRRQGKKLCEGQRLARNFEGKILIGSWEDFSFFFFKKKTLLYRFVLYVNYNFCTNSPAKTKAGGDKKKVHLDDATQTIDKHSHVSDDKFTRN